MKTKSILSLIVLSVLFCSVSYSQIDTAKSVKIRNTRLIIGDYYKITTTNLLITKGKLIAVNKSTILVMDVDRIKEFEIDEIYDIYNLNSKEESFPEVNNMYPATFYSVSAGYAQKTYTIENSNQLPAVKNSFIIKGFNVLIDAFKKTSDDFGLKIDLSYSHLFGDKYSGTGYTINYDSSYNKIDIDYSSLNIFALKSGFCFGSMKTDIPFNFYIYVGLGIGWLEKDFDIQYKYVTRNNITSLYQFSVNNKSDVIFGAHAQIRVSYKPAKQYRIFVEPSLQYWTLEMYKMFGVNGGFTLEL